MEIVETGKDRQNNFFMIFNEEKLRWTCVQSEPNLVPLCQHQRTKEQKNKDDDLYKLIKQIINVVPAIILKSNSLLEF